MQSIRHPHSRPWSAPSQAMSWKKCRPQRVLIRLFPRLLSNPSEGGFFPLFSHPGAPLFFFLLFSCIISMCNALGYDRPAIWSLPIYSSLAQSALLLLFSHSLAAISLRPSGFPCWVLASWIYSRSFFKACSRYKGDRHHILPFWAFQ